MPDYTDKCPICQSKDWDYDDTNIDGNDLVRECYCDVCDSTWTEIFTFTENKNIVDGRISS